MVPKEYRIYLCTAAEVIKIRFSHFDAGGYKHTMSCLLLVSLCQTLYLCTTRCHKLMHGLVMRQKLGMAMPITFYSSQLLSSRIQPLITSWGDFEISTNIPGTTLYWATHIPRRRSWPMKRTKKEVTQTKMLGVVILKRFFSLKVSLFPPLTHIISNRYSN